MGGLSIIHWLIVLVVMLPLYAVPAIIAFARGHRQRVAILLVNVLAGWTMIGWLGALVWSLLPSRSTEENHG